MRESPNNKISACVPTTGLHFHDIRQLLGVLYRLFDAGNTKTAAYIPAVAVVSDVGDNSIQTPSTEIASIEIKQSEVAILAQPGLSCGLAKLLELHELLSMFADDLQKTKKTLSKYYANKNTLNSQLSGTERQKVIC